jgi:hypothetical protein
LLDRGRRFWGGGIDHFIRILSCGLARRRDGRGGSWVWRELERGDFWKKGALGLNLCFFSLSKNEVDAETSTD